MAGRPRKIVDISTGKIGKEEKARRKAQEEKLKLGRDQLIAPEWLTEEAKEEFLRVVTEAAAIDLLDNLDMGILAIYSNAYAAYVELSKQIQEEGYTVIRTSKYETYTAVNPLVQAQEKQVKQIMQCSTKLGLATTDRLKLIVPQKEEQTVNKYAKYLNG